jgi:hypothetical protein
VILQDSTYALVTGNSGTGFADYAHKQQIDFGNTLAAALRVHNNQLVTLMLGKSPWDEVSVEAFDAALRFANFPGFLQCFSRFRNLDAGVRGDIFDRRPTLYHLASAANAVHAFKYMLAYSFETVKNEENEDVPIVSYMARTSTGRTFLHWAA